jgi:hypothetical protein
MRSLRSAVVLGLLGAACAITSAHAGCSSTVAATSESGAATSEASSSASTSGAGGAIGAGGAAAAHDAGSDGPPCAPAFIEAGTGWEGDAEIPMYHRAAPSCCPTERGPAPGTQPYGPNMANGCTTDSQCTQGLDGRCFPFGGLVWTGGCSYDECLTDSDCPSGAPCICRTSASDVSPNICAAGSNCVLDSDCGPGGFCSPSVFCDARLPGWPAYGYYCHTAADTCINDMDCPPIDSGGGCSIPSACLYDTQAKHWACNDQPCCPP